MTPSLAVDGVVVTAFNNELQAPYRFVKIRVVSALRPKSAGISPVRPAGRKWHQRRSVRLNACGLLQLRDVSCNFISANI